MKLKNLIFDFDGVIGDTQKASAIATSKVNGVSLEEAATSNFKYASHKPNHTRHNSLTEEDFKRIYQWTTDFGNEMLKIGFDLFTDFVQEIEAIETPHKAVVSSGSQRYVLPAMAKTNINPTHIMGYESHHSKEEKIEMIAKDWGCQLSEVYYFTDTLADVYELRDMIAEDKLIGVAWGYCGKDLLVKELIPENILDYPADIRKFFPIQ